MHTKRVQDFPTPGTLKAEYLKAKDSETLKQFPDFHFSIVFKWVKPWESLDFPVFI